MSFLRSARGGMADLNFSAKPLVALAAAWPSDINKRVFFKLWHPDADLKAATEGLVEGDPRHVSALFLIDVKLAVECSEARHRHRNATLVAFCTPITQIQICQIVVQLMDSDEWR